MSQKKSEKITKSSAKLEDDGETASESFGLDSMASERLETSKHRYEMRKKRPYMFRIHRDNQAKDELALLNAARDGYIELLAERDMLRRLERDHSELKASFIGEMSKIRELVESRRRLVSTCEPAEFNKLVRSSHELVKGRMLTEDEQSELEWLNESIDNVRSNIRRAHEEYHEALACEQYENEQIVVPPKWGNAQNERYCDEQETLAEAISLEQMLCDIRKRLTCLDEEAGTRELDDERNEQRHELNSLIEELRNARLTALAGLREPPAFEPLLEEYPPEEWETLVAIENHLDPIILRRMWLEYVQSDHYSVSENTSENGPWSIVYGFGPVPLGDNARMRVAELHAYLVENAHLDPIVAQQKFSEARRYGHHAGIELSEPSDHEALSNSDPIEHMLSPTRGIIARFRDVISARARGALRNYPLQSRRNIAIGSFEEYIPDGEKLVKGRELTEEEQWELAWLKVLNVAIEWDLVRAKEAFDRALARRSHADDETIESLESDSVDLEDYLKRQKAFNDARATHVLLCEEHKRLIGLGEEEAYCGEPSDRERERLVELEALIKKALKVRIAAQIALDGWTAFEQSSEEDDSEQSGDDTDHAGKELEPYAHLTPEELLEMAHEAFFGMLAFKQSGSVVGIAPSEDNTDRKCQECSTLEYLAFDSAKAILAALMEEKALLDRVQSDHCESVEGTKGEDTVGQPAKVRRWPLREREQMRAAELDTSLIDGARQVVEVTARAFNEMCACMQQGIDDENIEALEEALNAPRDTEYFDELGERITKEYEEIETAKRGIDAIARERERLSCKQAAGELKSREERRLLAHLSMATMGAQKAITRRLLRLYNGTGKEVKRPGTTSSSTLFGEESDA